MCLKFGTFLINVFSFTINKFQRKDEFSVSRVSATLPWFIHWKICFVCVSFDQEDFKMFLEKSLVHVQRETKCHLPHPPTGQQNARG